MAFESLRTAIEEQPNRFNKCYGENGAVCLESTLNYLVDSYITIKTGVSRDNIKVLFNKAINSYRKTNNLDALVDLATLIFEKRSINHGETRRDESRWMFLEFYQHFPNEAILLLPLFTNNEYGYWNDLNQIWRDICDELTNDCKSFGDTERFYDHYNLLITEIIRLFVTQRETDLLSLEKGESISMCAKWIHSENSAANKPRKADVRSAKRTHNAIIRKKLIEMQKDEQETHTLSVKKYKKRYKKTTKPRDTPIFWFYRNKQGELVRQCYVNILIRYIQQVRIKTFLMTDKIPTKLKKSYRQNNTKLRKALKLLEHKLCNKTPSEIEPSKLTAINMTRYSKYLYNEIATPPNKKNVKLKHFEETTGNREPDNPDMVDLRKRMKAFMGSREAVEKLTNKTSRLTPVDILSKLKQGSAAEKIQYETLWKSMTLTTKEQIAKYCEENNIRRRKIIPMVDLSGSMSTRLPGKDRKHSSYVSVADAAISLGIMTATSIPEDDPLYGIMLSFSAVPSWIHLPKNTSLQEMTESLYNNTKGDRLNTDFHKAYTLIIETLYKLVTDGKMTADDVKDVTLLVLSDLQFDQPSCPGYDSMWDTTYQQLEKMAIERGLPGLPTMIFWNLNNCECSIQAESTKKGVEFLSGYSQNNIRYAFYGYDNDNMLSETIINGTRFKMSKTSPHFKMMKIIYQPVFDPVREVFHNINRGTFKSYKYIGGIEEIEDTRIKEVSCW
tara:strand:- start:1707 stop:3887 length:2181 start_codon:yes stop_codon:yes gene_type:complete